MNNTTILYFITAILALLIFAQGRMIRRVDKELDFLSSYLANRPMSKQEDPKK